MFTSHYVHACPLTFVNAYNVFSVLTSLTTVYGSFTQLLNIRKEEFLVCHVSIEKASLHTRLLSRNSMQFLSF